MFPGTNSLFVLYNAVLIEAVSHYLCERRHYYPAGCKGEKRDVHISRNVL